MAMTEIWMPSPNYSTSRGPYNKVVLHTTEGAQTIEALGNFFSQSSAGVSSHFGADNVKRGTVGAYVYEQHKAWTQGNANPYCLSMELCTPSGAAGSWSRDYWLNQQSTLVHNAADWVAWMCGKYGVPIVSLSASQAQDPNVRGVCDHVDFGSWGGNHSDCGPGFPMDKVIEWAKASSAGGGGTTPPVSQIGKGVDYSWDRPDLSCLNSKGALFIVRYGSRDPSKNLTRAEIDKALSLGMGVAVVWQEGKTQMLRGYSGGQQDARDARAFFDSLGLVGIPIYFACDDDIRGYSSSQLASIDSYCDGAISEISKARMGGYGNYAFMQREFGNGKIIWGWQTYAWSSDEQGKTQWDSRAQLRQVENDVSVCGGMIDWDESRVADFGQWPRPAGKQEDDMTPSVAFWHDPETGEDSLHEAMRWADGRICYRGPGTSGGFWAVDEGSHSRSGVGIAVSEAGKVVITYVNMDGDICHYEREPGAWNWTWFRIGGDA